MDLKVSFAYFYGDAQHDAFLFAHTEDKWKRGEETTDYLSFFGFTSGLLHANGQVKYPIYLNHMHYKPLPSLSEPGVFTTYCSRLMEIIAELNAQGTTLPRNIVARILSNVCTMSQHLISNESFWHIVNKMLSNQLPAIEAYCVSGVTVDREYYLGLCMEHHVAGERNIASTWPWDSSCQTGSGGGVRKTLHTLNRRKFFKSYTPEHLDSLAKMLDGIYPHIVI